MRLFLLTVQTASVEFCEANKELPVTLPVGHIASVVTSDRPECDGSKHPWLITAAQGQRVNLTLYDITIDTKYASSFISVVAETADPRPNPLTPTVAI